MENYNVNIYLNDTAPYSKFIAFFYVNNVTNVNGGFQTFNELKEFIYQTIEK